MLVTPETYSPQKTRGFVVIEGVNGAGKSTVLSHIESSLQKEGISHVKTHEPGDTPLGKELRTLLLNSPHIPRTSLSELFLFGADRAQHVQEVIEPALKNRNVVLCDRYLYSTIAFQGFGRNLDLDLINSINSLAVGSCLPDLVILLDIPVEEGLARTIKRNQGVLTDTFEQEKLDFHQRIRTGFLEMAQSRGEPFAVLDARRTPEEVTKDALALVSKVIAARGLNRES